MRMLMLLRVCVELVQRNFRSRDVRLESRVQLVFGVKLAASQIESFKLQGED